MMFPTKRFYIELIKRGLVPLGHFWKGPWARALKQPWNTLTPDQQAFYMKFKHRRPSDETYVLEMGDPERQTPRKLQPTLSLDFWVDNADFYDAENMPGIFYFDSWEELQEKLTSGELGDTHTHTQGSG